MITETGKNLSVLITTETGQDWQTFATWYSIYKNLPDAKVAITSARNSETPFQYFQWTKKVNIPVIRHELFDTENEITSRLDAVSKAISQNIIGDHILVIKPLVMIIDVLDESILKIFNSDQHCFDKDVWFLKQPNIPDILNRFFLEESSIQIN